MFSLNPNLMLSLWSKITGFFTGWIKDVFDFLFEVIRVIIDYLVKPIYMVFLGVCKLLDIFELIAKKLAGMDVVYVNGSAVTGDLTLSLLNNNTVWKAFASMVALGSLLLFVTTFIAVVKSQMALGPRSSVRLVIRNFVMSLINFAIVPILCVAGIYFGNNLLKALDAATNQSGVNTVSAQVFLCASYDANRARDPSSRLMEKYLGPSADNPKGYNTANGTFKESGANGTAAIAIDKAFSQQTKIENCKFEFITLHKILLGNPLAGTAANLGVYSLFVPTDEQVEDEGLWSWFITKTTGSMTFTYYNSSAVTLYYNLLTFNYVIGIGAGIILLKCYLDLIFGLVKRLYMLVTLFIIVPPLIGLYPLDEGRALNGWKQKFIGNAISAYSAVVCMNIYLMMMGVFQTVTLFAESNSAGAVSADEIVYVEADSTLDIGNTAAGKALANLGVTLANEICQTIIIIAGAMFFKGMVGEVSQIIGAADAMHEGSGISQRLAQGAKKAVGAAATVAGAVATGGAALGAKGAATAAKAKASMDKMKAMKAAADGIKGGKGGKGGSGESGASGGDSAEKPDSSAKESSKKSNEQSAVNEEKELEKEVENAEKEEKKKLTMKDIGKGALKLAGKGALGGLKLAGKGALGAIKFAVPGSGFVMNAMKNGAISAYGAVGAAKAKHDLKKMPGGKEKIQQIENEYKEKIRAANAYDPVKNPLKARIKGAKENFRNKYMYKGVSQEDRNEINMHHQEMAGRKAAVQARTNQLKDEYRIAKRLGGGKREKERLDSYMRQIQNGLMQNENYWKQQASYQKQIMQQQERLANMMANKQAGGSKADMQKLDSDIAAIKQGMSEIQTAMKDDHNNY